MWIYIDYYKVRQAGINISNHKVIEALSRASMSVIKLASTNDEVFIRNGVSMSSNKNDEEATLLNNLLSVVQIENISCFETIDTLHKKFKIRLKIL